MVSGLSGKAQYGITLKSITNFKEVLGSVINISSILIGFIATMMSIIIAVADKRVIKRIRDYNGTDLVIAYFAQTLLAGFVVAIYSTSLTPFAESPSSHAKWALSIWGALVTFFIATAIRILHVMLGILRSVIEDVGDEIPEVVEADAEKAFQGKRKIEQ